MSIRNLPGCKGRPSRKAKNLIAICELIFRKCGNFDLSQSYSFPRPCTGTGLLFTLLSITYVTRISKTRTEQKTDLLHYSGWMHPVAYNDKIGKIITSFRNYVSTCITSRLTHYMFQLTFEPSSGELQNNNTKRKLQQIRCYIDRLTISAIT
jgi:hypothetical protein